MALPYSPGQVPMQQLVLSVPKPSVGDIAIFNQYTYLDVVRLNTSPLGFIDQVFLLDDRNQEESVALIINGNWQIYGLMEPHTLSFIPKPVPRAMPLDTMIDTDIEFLDSLEGKSRAAVPRLIENVPSLDKLRGRKIWDLYVSQVEDIPGVLPPAVLVGFMNDPVIYAPKPQVG
ncbi:unnamed protein product, partial [marine sediment metagenome]